MVIRAVVFDLGNVLIRWDARLLYRSMFNGDESAMTEFLTRIEFDAWNAQQDAGRSFAIGIAEKVAEYPIYKPYIEAYWTHWEESLGGVIDGTVIIMDELRRAGYPLFALSNWSAETFPRIRNRPEFEFLNWFDCIILSGEVKVAKPNPEIYHILLKQINYPPESCLFVDDSQPNIKAAQQVGLQAVQFTSPEQFREVLQNYNLLYS